MNLDKAHMKIDRDKVVYDSVEICKRKLLPKWRITMMAAFALQLHDKHGWGKKRLQELITEVGDTFDSVNKGYLSLDDIVETVENEIGLKLGR